MNTYTDCLVRRQPILGFCLAAGLMISPVEAARSQSIVTDGDIVGDGVSLLEIKEMVCELADQHALLPLPAICTLGAGERFIFATSTTSNAGGDLVQWANNILAPATFTDGLVAGDAICQKHADDAGLPGSYTAWLSTDTVDGKDRIGNHTWIRRDGQVVAYDKDELLTCRTDCLQVSLQSENATTNNHKHWTGTYEDGTVDLNGSQDPWTCQNWTDSSQTQAGTAGQPANLDFSWTAETSYLCDAAFGLVCFQN